ncbi:MAG: putative peptidoglycan glycosyltransferase FtsW [Cyanobacteria bacterium P01_D01_bin.73]
MEKWRSLLGRWGGDSQGWAAEARVLRWLTLLWLVLGWIVLLSASYASADLSYGDGLYYCKRQLIWIGLGLGLMQATSMVPLRVLLRTAPWAVIFALAVLWSLLIPGLGYEVNGAVRWIQIGPLPIQPSELLKPLLVLHAAMALGQWDRLRDRQRWFWLGSVAIALIGILLQPNLSTASLCGISLWLVAMAAGLPLTYLWGTALGGSLLAVISISLRSYQQRRIIAFLNPWADPQGNGYQLVQSLMAIGSGSFWGTGFGLSKQKLANLPIQYTDFIFSVYAEEFGLVGSLMLLALIAVYGGVGLWVAVKTQSATVRLVATGSVVFLVGQSLLNIGVATGGLPTTGLPLPFFSYGGSSMLASCILAGLLTRAARESSAPVTALPRRNGTQKKSRQPG